jgi:UDP-GlcNAc3NAcA epimerase
MATAETRRYDIKLHKTCPLMIKILTIIGARPQIIKSSALSRCIRDRYSDRIQELVVHTGQHYSQGMSGLHFDQMGLASPEIQLHIDPAAGAVVRMSQMMTELADCFQKYKPNFVLVYGDTDSTLAAALAANLCQIPLAHVEAGLRSFNPSMPEERNRVLTDHISNVLFPPTKSAWRQLQKELTDKKYVSEMVGDVMLDNALHFMKIANRPSSWPLENQNYVLFTAHRAATMDDPEKLKALLIQLDLLLAQNEVVWPMHPRVTNQLQNLMGNEGFAIWNNKKGLHIIEPIGYTDTLWALKNASFVCTDSGGLQKEAVFLGKGVIILRDETEWVELIENNCAILVGLDSLKMSEALMRIPQVNAEEILKLYGSGDAASLICETLLQATEK